MRLGDAWQKEINSILPQNQTEEERQPARPCSTQTPQRCTAMCRQVWLLQQHSGMVEPRSWGLKAISGLCASWITRFQNGQPDVLALQWSVSPNAPSPTHRGRVSCWGCPPWQKDHRLLWLGASLPMAPKASAKWSNSAWNGTKYTHLQQFLHHHVRALKTLE